MKLGRFYVIKFADFPGKTKRAMGGLEVEK
jgi:hypothetical protein